MASWLAVRLQVAHLRWDNSVGPGQDGVHGDDWVPNISDGLNAGWAKLVDQGETVPGDIVIQGGFDRDLGMNHIGICMNQGCTDVLSDSNSRQTFSWRSGPDFYDPNASWWQSAGNLPPAFYHVRDDNAPMT